MGELAGRKILLIHFRVGRTDGVSLQIGAWKEIFARQGLEVKLAGGSYSLGADWTVEHLENQLDPEVFAIDEAAFGRPNGWSKSEFAARFAQLQNALTAGFGRVVAEARPDWVVVSNIFSVGQNVAAAGALSEVMRQAKVPTVAVHHDWYWEDARYTRPSNELVRGQLQRFFPPRWAHLRQVCINSLARTRLAAVKGIAAAVLPDTLDFGRDSFTKSTHGWTTECGHLLRRHGVRETDIVVLQGTRVVRRKNIELAMGLVAGLQRKLGRVKLYDGREYVPGRDRVALVMAGYADKRDQAYLGRLIAYGQSLGIKVVHVDGVAGGYHRSQNGACALLDVYPYADVVTYPSQYEGFGNQFLEAVYARKPVVLFEYPVYQTDIGPLGFKAISLGDRVEFDQDDLAHIPPATLASAVDRTAQILTDRVRYQDMVQTNFALGRQNFSYPQAWERWRVLLKN